MILRSIASKLKAHDWGAAAIEIGIVVLGIFIGLQVDDWNNARKDRAAEREYLARLHADVQTLVIMQSDRIDNRLALLDELSDAADVLIGEAPLSDWDETDCRALMSSHIFVPLPTEIPVLNEMTATGSLRLIRDVRLRDALSRLQIQVSRSDEMIGRLNAGVRVLNRHYPEALREIIVPESGDSEARHDDEPVCELEAIRSNPALLSDVADNYSRYRAYALFGLQDTHEEFQHLHALLDEILSINHDDAPGANEAAGTP